MNKYPDLVEVVGLHLWHGFLYFILPVSLIVASVRWAFFG